MSDRGGGSRQRADDDAERPPLYSDVEEFLRDRADGMTFVNANKFYAALDHLFKETSIKNLEDLPAALLHEKVEDAIKTLTAELHGDLPAYDENANQKECVKLLLRQGMESDRVLSYRSHPKYILSLVETLIAKYEVITHTQFNYVTTTVS